VLQELDTLAREGRHFEVIVLDPPSFSNSKNMQTTFDVQRDHLGVLMQCLDLLAPGGELFFSTNKRKFQFARQELLDLALQRYGSSRRNSAAGGTHNDRRSAPPRRSDSTGSAERNNRAANEVLDIRKITKLTMPEDFEGTKIHHVWSIARKR
jgi:23S rRNA (cytosine1962-C5)-methyltransferase